MRGSLKVLGFGLLFMLLVSSAVADPQTNDPIHDLPTIYDRLEAKATLVVTRDNLARCAWDFGEACGIPIDVRTDDLQEIGITMSRSFGMEMRDQPINQILEQLIRKADVPRGPIAASELEMVYVIDDREGFGKERVIITSRQRAWQRGTPGKIFQIPKPE